MSKILFLFTFIIAIFITGCKNSNDHTSQSSQGTITYIISYPDSSKYGTKHLLFPRTMTLVFKSEKATFITSAGLGMIQMVNLLDQEQSTFIALLIDNLRENYGCKLSAKEIENNENMQQYDFETSYENKIIAGIECRKSIGKDMKTGSATEVYYDPGVKFNYFNSPFKDVGHLMLEYTHTINNLTLKLTASKVDYATPVDTGLFRLKGSYHWVDQKSFYAYLNSF